MSAMDWVINAFVVSELWASSSQLSEVRMFIKKFDFSEIIACLNVQRLELGSINAQIAHKLSSMETYTFQVIPYKVKLFNVQLVRINFLKLFRCSDHSGYPLFIVCWAIVEDSEWPQFRKKHRKVASVGNVLHEQLFYKWGQLYVPLDIAEWYIN